MQNPYFHAILYLNGRSIDDIRKGFYPSTGRYGYLVSVQSQSIGKGESYLQEARKCNAICLLTNIYSSTAVIREVLNSTVRVRDMAILRMRYEDVFVVVISQHQM